MADTMESLNIDGNTLVALLAVLVGGAVSIFTAWYAGARGSAQQRLQRKQTYALADVSTRLSVFQQAYVQWEKALGVVHAAPPEKQETLAEVGKWVSRKRIYLGKGLSDKFRQGLIAIDAHASLLEASREIWRNGGDAMESRKQVRENWREIMDLGEAIASAAALPTFGEAQAIDS